MLRDANRRVLGDIDRLLSNSLFQSGYIEKSYYLVPEGFAIVTQMEQTFPDGRPRIGTERWSVQAAPRVEEWSLAAYLRALLTAPEGYYRVIALIVTPVRFTEASASITGQQGIALVRGGSNRPPDEIERQPVDPDVVCTALIYEFQRRQGMPDVLVPGRLDAMTHLRQSGLWAALRGN